MKSLASLLRKAFGSRAVLSATAPTEPTSGLVVVNATVSAQDAQPATLRLFVNNDAAPAFDKPLSLKPEGEAFWLALHGQLLPNGKVPIRLDLVGPGGALLASQGLTLNIHNTGQLAERVAESLRRNRVPLVLDGVCDSGDYDYSDASFAAWFDREPAEIEAHLERLAESGQATPDEVEALRHFTQKGFLVVPDAVDPAHVGRINEAIDDAVARKVEGYEWGSSQRIHNLHQQYPAIRDLWLHPKVMRLLALIFEAPAQPCQSLTYVFGSQQEHHQDTIHLTPFPAGRMCGVWTALEDVQPESGELMVFPGSHRLPRVYMRSVGLPKIRDDEWQAFHDVVVSRWTDLINAKGYAPELYRPKAGTVLIWHENLMHAGAMRRDLSKSRRSIVGHYFAHGAVVYYDSSGLPGALHPLEAA